MTFPSPPVSRAWVSTRERISFDGRFDEVGGRPRGPRPGDAEDEVAQDVAAVRSVDDLGVELDPEEPAAGVGQAGEGRGRGLGRGDEACRQPGDRVAVAHPDRLVPLEAREEAILGRDRDRRRSVLPTRRRQDVAAQLEGHQLGPVADAQHRDPPVPDRRIRLRGTLVVDGVGAARQDDRAGPAALQLGIRSVVRKELRVDVELADAAGDELGELAAEVEDDDGVGLGRARLAAGDGAPRPIELRALGRPGVEGDLQVRLDLGVVRGEHAVARVGGSPWTVVPRCRAGGRGWSSPSPPAEPFAAAELPAAELPTAAPGCSPASLNRSPPTPAAPFGRSLPAPRRGGRG